MLQHDLKHGNQQTNIVKYMVDSELLSLDGNTLFVEFGAGKAGLSSFVCNELEGLEDK
jgi:hypothetical protein